MLLLEEKLQSRQNITSSQASKALYLFLSGRVVLTASMAKTLRNIVNGNTSRLTIVNDISATNISSGKKRLNAIPGNWSLWDDNCNWLSEEDESKVRTLNILNHL